MTSYPMWLLNIPVRISTLNLVILGQSVLEIYEPLTQCRAPFDVLNNKQSTNWQNAAPLNFKISADIRCVINADLASNRDRIIRIYGAPLKFDLKAEVAFLSVVSNIDKCRAEVAGGVISGMAVDGAGADIRVTFGDSTLNNGLLIRLLAGRTRFTHFCAVFNCIWQPIGSS